MDEPPGVWMACLIGEDGAPVKAIADIFYETEDQSRIG